MNALGENSPVLEFERRLARLEGLLSELGNSKDILAERTAREVVTTVLELHRRGLARVLELAGAASSAFATDPLVLPLLFLHDLHPVPPRARAEAAVEALKRRFSNELSHAELIVRGDVLELKLEPKPGLDRANQARLQRESEAALLAAAPDLEAITITVAPVESQLVQLRIRAKTETPHPKSGGLP